MHHHHHAHEISVNAVLVFCTVLNLLFVAVEAAVGYAQNSISLLSDAGHNLGDTLSLVLVIIAFALRSEEAKKNIGVANALLLLVAVGLIFYEGIEKLLSPEVVNGSAMIWTAAAAIVVNGLTAFLLMRNQHGDNNMRAAFLHMLSDTLVSVGVVVSGIVIAHTGINIIDPIVSIVIAIIILVPTVRLLADAVNDKKHTHN